MDSRQRNALETDMSKRKKKSIRLVQAFIDLPQSLFASALKIKLPPRKRK